MPELPVNFLCPGGRAFPPQAGIEGREKTGETIPESNRLNP
jgi:hypothetical protein